MTCFCPLNPGVARPNKGGSEIICPSKCGLNCVCPSNSGGPRSFFLRILAYLVIYDAGQVSLEHLLLSRHPSHRAHAPVDVMNENPLSQPTLSVSTCLNAGLNSLHLGFRCHQAYFYPMKSGVELFAFLVQVVRIIDSGCKAGLIESSG